MYPGSWSEGVKGFDSSVSKRLVVCGERDGGISDSKDCVCELD
jgi:hypothetical protein